MPDLGIFQPFVEEMGLTTFTASTATEALTRFNISLTSDIGQSIIRRAQRLMASGLQDQAMEFSANQIIDHFRNIASLEGIATPAGFRRTNFLAQIRNIKQRPIARDYYKSVPSNRLPNPDRFAPGPPGMTSNYSVLVEVRGKNTITGLEDRTYMRINSMDLLTPGEVKALAAQYYGENPATYSVVAESYVASTPLINPNGVV